MKKSKFSLALCSILFSFTLVSASISEARPGGGRSSGFRGSRGFGYSNPSSAPNRNQGNPQTAPYSGNSQQPNNPNPGFGNANNSGGFMRGMMGGIAGGVIGSMLFGSLGHAGTGGFGGGGIGLIEILLFGGLAFMAYRMFSQRKLGAGAQRNAYSADAYSGTSLPTQNAPQLSRMNSESELSQQLQASNPGFDLARFKDERMDDFIRLQTAWNGRDISTVAPYLAPELQQQLESDISDLKRKGQINRIESIMVRNTELIETWSESGQEFATVRFKANLLDYTVNESNGQVVSGDSTSTIKFEEDWTFVHAVTGNIASPKWKLSAIEA